MRPDTTMKYMILLYDNADMREIFSSRSDLMEEMDGLLEEIRQASRRHSSQRLGSGRRQVFPSTRVRGSSRPLPAEVQQDRRLTTSHRVPAVRGHLLELAGDSAAAAEAQHIACRLTTSRPERDYLVRKAAAITG